MCVFIFEKVVIGGRNKYLINGSNANNTRVQDLFRSVQLNVNNPHFLIMQGRITKVLNMKPPEVWRRSATYIGIGDSEILLNKSNVLGNFSMQCYNLISIWSASWLLINLLKWLRKHKICFKFITKKVLIMISVFYLFFLDLVHDWRSSWHSSLWE